MALKDFLTDVPRQFDAVVKGRVCLLDGDFPAYKASATVKQLKTAVNRFLTLCETERILTDAETVRIHITPEGCYKLHRFFYPTAQVYQANRKGKPKPILLEQLRGKLQELDMPKNMELFYWYDREADDGLMMDAYQFPTAIMNSGDKDLNIAPCGLWLPDECRIDYIEDRYGWIATKSLSSGNKLIGHGTKFFWAQMLAGDYADNVKGILLLDGQKCGNTKAVDLLRDIKSESDAAELVIRKYLEIGQNPLAEAECLWLRRTYDDSAFRYISELGLPDKLQRWINDLNTYNLEYVEYMIEKQRQELLGYDETTEDVTRNEEDGDGDRPPW